MKRYLPALLLIAAGVGLTVIGAALGQPELVLAKAVRICMECVGLG